MNLKESLDNAKGHQIIPKNPLCCTQPPPPELLVQRAPTIAKKLLRISNSHPEESHTEYIKERERERERVAWLAGNESGW